MVGVGDVDLRKRKLVVTAASMEKLSEKTRRVGRRSEGGGWGGRAGQAAIDLGWARGEAGGRRWETLGEGRKTCGGGGGEGQRGWHAGPFRGVGARQA